jgi:two-component system, NtrC family, sensor histidine kinase HydH
VSQHHDMSPDVAKLERQFHARVCHVCGTSIGVLFGILDAWSAKLMGYEVLFRGAPAFWHQVLFHVVVFGALGFAFGRAWDRRAQLKKALEVIQRQYEDLKANQQHLIQSEKLAVIGSLSASIAHEIRNPLGIMRSSASLISEDLPPEHSGQKPLEFIRDEIDRLSGLIEGLLVFAKPKQPLLARADVNGLLERSMEFMGAELRKRRIEVRRELAQKLPEAYVDPDQIHQVFLGLLLNSMQAIQEDGAITVRTALFRDPASGADRLRITVSDSGKGIASENLEKIFEPFFTTKQEGTGLGLAVARQIVTGHGGRIAASSAPGKGAEFEILLPLPQVAAVA